jgi:hypothetical protein
LLLSRQEFIDYFSKDCKITITDDSPLWIPEQQIYPIGQSNWFLDCKPLSIENTKQFWKECRFNTKGHFKCYSSSIERQIEWWGFTILDDAIWFKLRFS